MSTSDEAAFLRAIQADPADATAKLVYADWLDDRGEPERAAYLRLLATGDGETAEGQRLALRVGSCWRGWLSIPLPAWEGVTLYALGRLEAVFDYHKGVCQRLGVLAYDFSAWLKRSPPVTIVGGFSAVIPAEWHPVRVEPLGDWETELARLLRKWFFDGWKSDRRHVTTDRETELEAYQLASVLDAVRDVLRPVRGWRARIAPSRYYYADWDHVALEAADRVLFLHFSCDD